MLFHNDNFYHLPAAVTFLAVSISIQFMLLADDRFPVLRDFAVILKPFFK